MTQSAAANYFCNRSNLRAAAVALCLAIVVATSARLGGAEPDFPRAEIWIGGQRVQSATTPVDDDQRAVVYIDGQRVDPLARSMPRPAATTMQQPQQPAPPSGRPVVPMVERAATESSGPLVIEFPTPGRYPAPQRAPTTSPIPDEAIVAPAIPSVAVGESTRDVQPAVLHVPEDGAPSNVELAARFSAADESERQVITAPAIATPSQTPELLPDVQQQMTWSAPPAPLVAKSPLPRVQRTNLSPWIFFWPLVIGLLLVFYIQRKTAK